MDKLHTTNYFDTFILVADDCKVFNAEIPPVKNGKKTIANIEFEIINKNPYKYTSDEVLFMVHAIRNDLVESELDEARKQFFSKGQACFRSSPLTKQYGWGVHSDKNGKIAIHAMESDEYENFCLSSKVNLVKAMKSSK